MCSCFVARDGGSRYWLSWFIVSIVASIFAIIFASAIYANLGGPLPTAHWAFGMILLLIVNFLAIIFSILCILIIITVNRNKKIGISVFVYMVIIFIMSLAAGISLGHFPGAEEMSPYVKSYYETNEEPPPVLNILQDVSVNFFPRGFSCCGGKNYHDYTDTTKKESQPGHFIFTVPDSCCTEENRENENCGKDLDFAIHENLNEVTELYITYYGKAPDFIKEIEAIANDSTKSIDEIKLRALLEKYDVSIPENRSQIVQVFKVFKDNLLKDLIKIGVVGCGQFLDVLYNVENADLPEDNGIRLLGTIVKTVFKALTGIIVVKVLIVLITVVVFAYYYKRWNMLPPTPVTNPTELNDGENVPAAEVGNAPVPDVEKAQSAESVVKTPSDPPSPLQK